MPDTPPNHILSELGLDLWLAGRLVRGRAEVVPQMCIPGTGLLRSSIFASWADMATGLVCIGLYPSKITVTLDLAVELIHPVSGRGDIEVVAWAVQADGSAIVTEVEFTAAGDLLARGTAAFAALPDAARASDPVSQGPALIPFNERRLSVPFAERAGCECRGPGIASMARRDDGLNAADTINGALLSLVVEEAALSAAPEAMLSSLAVRYLRPARIGPVLGTAQRRGAITRVEVRDSGSAERLVALATTRSFAAARPSLSEGDRP